MKPIHTHGCNCCTALRTKLLNSHLLSRTTPATKQPLVSLRSSSSSDVASLGRKAVTLNMPDAVLDKLRLAAARDGLSLDEFVTRLAEDSFAQNAALESLLPNNLESLDTVYVLEPIITLVDGLLHGEHTVAQAMRHGDMGLGTLDLLDGEVVVYQGVAYHQSADGIVKVLTGSERTPFMTLTRHDPRHLVTLVVREDLDYEGLQHFMKERVFRSGNVFYALEVRGEFPAVTARAVRKQDHDRPLVEVAADQAMFHFEKEDGVLVGFYSPDYMGSSINVPGFHLHYLSEDKQRGGHLLGCTIKAGATISVQEIHRVKVDLPYRDAFMRSHLDRDIKKEIEAAENEREKK